MRQQALARLALLALVAAACLAGALLAGSVSVDWRELWSSAPGSTARTILLELRLPRAVAAFCVGALLALSGALMQVLLKNPLADPYLLGVSGGAAVGALGCIALGLAALSAAGAFGGALLAVVIVFGLARGDASFTHSRLLLTGVVTASGWGAVVALILSLAPDSQLRGMVFWLLGDLSGSGWPLLATATLALSLAVTWPAARALNVMVQGDLSARALGVPVASLRRLAYFVASACAAAAVTTAGSIGFVGLVAPHLTRLMLGADHRLMLPGAALTGGALLTAADTLARTALAPTQLPVGAITAVIGVPLFLFLLARRR